MDDGAGGVEPAKGFPQGCGGHRNVLVKCGPLKELWEFGVVHVLFDGAVDLFLQILLVEVVVEVGTVVVGIVVEMLKRQSRLPSLSAGVEIAGRLPHSL